MFKKCFVILYTLIDSAWTLFGHKLNFKIQMLNGKKMKNCVVAIFERFE